MEIRQRLKSLTSDKSFQTITLSFTAFVAFKLYFLIFPVDVIVPEQATAFSWPWVILIIVLGYLGYFISLRLDIARIWDVILQRRFETVIFWIAAVITSWWEIGPYVESYSISEVAGGVFSWLFISNMVEAYEFKKYGFWAPLCFPVCFLHGLARYLGKPDHPVVVIDYLVRGSFVRRTVSV
jgi:hypothetical protein